MHNTIKPNRTTTRTIAILIAAFAGVIVATNARAEITQTELYNLADEAEHAFRQANDISRTRPDESQRLYEQAILRFEKIIDQGEIANPHLYYNVANAYLLKGDIGHAILNYRRAQHLGSTNPDLAKNLDFARRKRLDQIPVQTQKRVLQTLFFWHYDFTLSTRFLLGGVFWSFACLLSILAVWRRRRILVAAALLSLLLSFALIGSVALDMHRSSTNNHGVITAESVIARQGDSENYPTSFTDPLHAGTEFELLESRGQWLHIRLANAAQAWIPTNTAEVI